MSVFYKNTLIVLGMTCVALGSLGVFVPLLPTTPFLLLAAFCFGKASPKMASWLLNTPVLGKYIDDYRQKKGLPLLTKISTLLLLWISIISSAIFATDTAWVRLLLIFVASAVSFHIFRLPTKKASSPKAA